MALTDNSAKTLYEMFSRRWRYYKFLEEQDHLVYGVGVGLGLGSGLGLALGVVLGLELGGLSYVLVLVL